MKHALLLIFLAASFVSAQEKSNVIYQSAGPVGGAMAFGSSGSPVQGAPYSATITNETVQTLADGTRIMQTNTGTTARDSQGRTRQDMPLPAIGNLAATNAPRLAFIHDPVAQTSYTLNLTDKTAQQLSPLPPLAADAASASGVPATASTRVIGVGVSPMPPSPEPIPGTVAVTSGAMFLQKQISDEPAPVTTEDLGSQTMEGVLVNGTRSTRVIPVGEIGNDRPIAIVTEVWISPDLKTVIYSKRSDPRIGETTFRLSNIARTEPDPTLFTVPSDFKITEGPKTILYRSKP
jgi:hypothetical protein